MPDEVLDQVTDETVLDQAITDADGTEDQVPPAGGEGEPEPEPQARPGADVDENLIDPSELSLTQLRSYLQKHPALQKLDTEDKAFHNFLYANVRRSSQLEDFRKVFATADSANEALRAANELIDFESDFFDTREGAKRTLQRLYEKSLLRDDSGQLAMDATGRPQSTGAFEGLITQIRTDLWGQAEAFLKQKNDEYGLEALAYLKSLYGDGPAKKAGVATHAGESEPPNEDRLTPDEKRKLSEHEQLVRESEQRRMDGSRAYEMQLRQEMDVGVLTDANHLMKDIVTKNKVAINDKMQALIVRDAVEELAQKAMKDPAYRTLLTTMMRRPRTEATRQEIVKQVRQYAKRYLPSLVASQLQEATGTVIAGYAAKQTKIAGQKSKANVRSSGQAPSPQNPSIEERLRSRTEAAKRRLTDREVIDAVTTEDES